MDPEINKNQFIGKTATTPRPSPEAHKGTHDMLLRDQARWDQARAWDQDNEQRKADRIAAIDAEREQRRREDQQRRGDAFLAPAKAAFLAAGGTEAGWNARKDAIVAELAERAAVAAVTDAETERARMQRTGAYSM